LSSTKLSFVDHQELTSTAMSEACIDLGIQYIYTLCSIPPTSKEVGFLLQFIVKNAGEYLLMNDMK